MSKSGKAKDKRIQELEAKLAEQEEDDNDDEEEDTESPAVDKEALLDFLLETDGAIKYRDAIEEELSESP
jgi:hypothetical protein